AGLRDLARRRREQEVVRHLFGLPLDARREQGPALPCERSRLIGAVDQEVVTEYVSDEERFDSAHGADRQLEGHAEPISSVHEHEVHEDELPDVAFVGAHVAEGEPAILKVPPASVGHASKADVAGYDAEP